MLFKPKKTAAKGARPRSPNPKPHLHLHRKGKELAYQVKARLIQSSRKRSAERARTHRSARRGSRGKQGGGRAVGIEKAVFVTGVRGRRKLRVFWSINFEKHVEGVCNGMFRRILKL